MNITVKVQASEAARVGAGGSQKFLRKALQSRLDEFAGEAIVAIETHGNAMMKQHADAKQAVADRKAAAAKVLEDAHVAAAAILNGDS